MLFENCLTFLLLWNMKEYSWEMSVFFGRLVINILIFLHILCSTEGTLTDLEQHEGE